jgi:hypothetical protein
MKNLMSANVILVLRRRRGHQRSIFEDSTDAVAKPGLEMASPARVSHVSVSFELGRCDGIAGTCSAGGHLLRNGASEGAHSKRVRVDAVEAGS